MLYHKNVVEIIFSHSKNYLNFQNLPFHLLRNIGESRDGFHKIDTI